MKKKVIYLVIALVFYAVFVSAEDNNPPAGMKIEKVGDLQILVPEGVEVRRTGKGGLISVETTEEYLSRQLLDMERRIEEIENQQKDLKSEIERLNEVIYNIQGKLINLENPNE
jgi:peptidoglycan hydrolase CwlO-like protein